MTAKRFSDKACGSTAQARKKAAAAWCEAQQIHLTPIKGDKAKMRSALITLVFDEHIRDWLAANDPMALRQAQRALRGSDFTEYLPNK